MAQQGIPILQRSEEVKESQTPDIQSAYQNLAASDNTLSNIGAQVAQRSSQAIASQLGYESGKNPHGDIGPTLTEFDKNFKESYQVQSQSVLSLQAQKLLDDSQVELAKHNRLTPGMIDKAHEQVQLGLSKISSLAPMEIRPQLEQSFNSSLMQHTTQLKEKMFTQQREDAKDNLIAAINLNVQKANELAQSGDFKGAELAANAAKAAASNGGANKYFTPNEVRVTHETAEQSKLNGQYIHLATNALKGNRYEAFIKELADNTHGMTHEQHIGVLQSVNQQVVFIKNLEHQEDDLKAQNMLNQIATNPNSITATQWSNFESSVAPLKSAQVKFHYIQALKADQKENGDSNTLIQNWSDPRAQANASEKVANDSFNKLVSYQMNRSKNTAAPLSQDMAEVNVAASAGAAIPVMTKTLKDKLRSGNPAMIESAAMQMHALQELGAGHALSGLDEKDIAMFGRYDSIRNSDNKTEAAREITNETYNQQPEVEQMNKQKWSNMLSNKAKDASLSDFALNQALLSSSDFINPAMANVYGAEILSKYQRSFMAANGDDAAALKNVKQFVKDNFGETGVNGDSYQTMRPLEKVLGFKDRSGVPFIQQDVVTQLNKKLVPVKELFAAKKTNEYWEVEKPSDDVHGFFRDKYDPVKIKRHLRTATGIKTDTFNIILQGNAYDWDVSIETDSGMRNLHQFAPYLGITTYQPDSKAIKDAYNKVHKLN